MGTRVMHGKAVGICPYCGSTETEETDENADIALNYESNGLCIYVKAQMICDRCHRRFELRINDAKLAVDECECEADDLTDGDDVEE